MNYPPGHLEQLISKGVFEIQRLQAENEQLRKALVEAGDSLYAWGGVMSVDTKAAYKNAKSRNEATS